MEIKTIRVVEFDENSATILKIRVVGDWEWRYLLNGARVLFYHSRGRQGPVGIVAFPSGKEVYLFEIYRYMYTILEGPYPSIKAAKAAARTHPAFVFASE